MKTGNNDYFQKDKKPSIINISINIILLPDVYFYQISQNLCFEEKTQLLCLPTSNEGSIFLQLRKELNLMSNP